MEALIFKSSAMPAAIAKPKFARSRKARLNVKKTTGIIRNHLRVAMVLIMLIKFIRLFK